MLQLQLSYHPVSDLEGLSLSLSAAACTARNMLNAGLMWLQQEKDGNPKGSSSCLAYTQYKNEKHLKKDNSATRMQLRCCTGAMLNKI